MKKTFLLLVIFGICSCASLSDFRADLIAITEFPDKSSVKVLKTPSPDSATQFVVPTTSSDDLVALPHPESKLIRQGPGRVSVPILLYHHITESNPTNAYSVSKAAFREQLEYLYQNEFRTISIADLVRSIKDGAELPPKPVIISFDDGNQNVFGNAYPIMREKGFTGVALVIANRINAEGFLSAVQLRRLYEQGWEIGSHGMRHIDLVKEPQALRDEIGNSKKSIENVLDLNITLFAYPYGKADHITIDWVKRIGYISALGLGISNLHGTGNLFYLQRREVKNEFSLVEFAQLLESN